MTQVLLPINFQPKELDDDSIKNIIERSNFWRLRLK